MISTFNEINKKLDLKSKIPAASWIHKKGSTNAVIFDLETTSLDPVKDCIIQIAAQSWLHPEKKFNIFINPGIEIPADASRIHGNYES